MTRKLGNRLTLKQVRRIRRIVREKARNIYDKFEFPYSLSLEDMRAQQEMRYRAGIYELARDYLKNRWGIQVSQLEDMRGLFFFRHVARPNMEVAAASEIAKYIGEGFWTSFYTSDGWFKQPEKISLVKPVTVDPVGKTVKRERFREPEEGEVLSNLVDSDGNNLMEKYGRMIVETHSRVLILDMTRILSELVFMNMKHGEEKIPEIAIEEDGKIVSYEFKGGMYGKYSIDEVRELAKQGKARPSAKWYYQEFYFFMPGIWYTDLVCTVGPWEQDDKKMRRIIDEGYRKVEEVTGFHPMFTPLMPMGTLKIDELNKRVGKNAQYALFLDELNLDLEGVRLDRDYIVDDLWEVSVRCVEELVIRTLECKIS